jgi:hypothetical protein
MQLMVARRYPVVDAQARTEYVARAALSPAIVLQRRVERVSTDFDDLRARSPRRLRCTAPKWEAARRRNSNPTVVDQTAINIGFAVRR